MGGKGRRRREKNYRASHDGDARLPPPPKLKELEAIPSKLRRLIKLKSTPDQGAQKPREDAGSEKRKRGRKAADQEENVWLYRKEEGFLGFDDPMDIRQTRMFCK